MLHVKNPSKKLQRQVERSVRALSPRAHPIVLIVALGLSLGCLLSAVLPPPITIGQLLALSIGFVLLTSISLWKNAPHLHRWVLSFAVLLLTSLTGRLWHNPRLPNSALPPSQNDSSAWIVEIASLPKGTARNYKYQINTLLFCQRDSTPVHWSTKAILYLDALDSSSAALRPGDIVLLAQPIIPFEASDTVSLFSFPFWARTHGIAGSAFASALSLLPLNAANDAFRYRSLRMHGKIIDKMKAVGIGQPEIGPITAMTFGERTELSADINRNFRSSGLAHILAISGFHVGIVFWIFQLLTKPIIIRSQLSAALRYLTPAIAVWLYAAFCGFAPPIVRASTIATVYALSLVMRVYITRLETFFISLAVVLLAQPSAPYDIGFYLSFLAVAGIAIFMPLLNEIFPVRARGWRGLCNLFFLSISAQLATAPLLLVAFKSLPLIGILASVPASLLAFPILVGGLLVAVLPMGSLLARIIAFPLQWTGKGLVYISHAATQLNPAFLSNINLPLPTIVLGSLAIVALALFAIYRKRWFLAVFAALLAAAIIFEVFIAILT